MLLRTQKSVNAKVETPKTPRPAHNAVLPGVPGGMVEGPQEHCSSQEPRPLEAPEAARLLAFSSRVLGFSSGVWGFRFGLQLGGLGL